MEPTMTVAAAVAARPISATPIERTVRPDTMRSAIRIAIAVATARRNGEMTVRSWPFMMRTPCARPPGASNRRPRPSGATARSRRGLHPLDRGALAGQVDPGDPDEAADRVEDRQGDGDEGDLRGDRDRSLPGGVREDLRDRAPDEVEDEAREQPEHDDQRRQRAEGQDLGRGHVDEVMAEALAELRHVAG